MDGMIIDSFAGGGGASTGIHAATGRSPDIAINHCEIALGMHAANHPETLHLVENIWKVNLDDYTRGRKIGLLWASPDCRHFSKARGGAPTSKSVRGLAHSIVKFVHETGQNAPDMIGMENVEEFLSWEDYSKWKKALEKFGYKIEHRVLRACDYGAPTIRKRLFILMRRDGKPIVWPEPDHGSPDSVTVKNGKLKPWKTAASIIDWSLPCPSIFDSSETIKEMYGLRAVRPLSDNTLRRVATGVVRYVLEAKEPFVVTLGQQGGSNRSGDLPLHTVTASKGDQNAIIVPTLAQVGYGEREGQAPRVPGLHKPLGTIVAGGGKAALIAAFLAQHNTGVVGHPATAPLSTITGRGTQQNIVAASLLHLKGSDRRAGPIDTPLATVCATGTHAALVSAFLVKYYGAGVGQYLTEPLHTVTTKDRYGLVTLTIQGEQYVIVDIGMRMLSPRELFRAQGFPDDYRIDTAGNGKPIGKTQQVHKCGNSVPPVMVKKLIAANWKTEAMLPSRQFSSKTCLPGGELSQAKGSPE